ncbi:MAG: amidohydrolase family protein [Candidatus Aminicenantes bacterium]|nr:MAG: amidohydrolase family protein [Candidatus Aminicenantes bacterium]
MQKKEIVGILAICIMFLSAEAMMGETKGVESGQRYEKLVIRNVLVIDGKGTPPRGPVDIILKGNSIQSVRSANHRPEAYRENLHVLDGSGLYALPGLINIHAHIHDNRGGVPIPFEYLYKLWLSCGITAVRDVGSNYEKTIQERQKSQEGTITAPRIFLYMRAGGRTPEEAKQSIQRIKKLGGDGVKIFGMDRDIMKAALMEANELGFRVVHHVGVEETDAWDDAELGVTSIEHWYGVPDAALLGSQNFAHDYNYSNESDRFRYAGRLWREADPEKLKSVLQTLVEKGVSWCPTFVIYEANRDLLRAKNQPWFKDYLHPALAEYFKPSPSNHGSYHWNWTTTDEVFWRENYKIWMKAVRKFASFGGIVGAGEDAGYIYMTYGFSLIRELELHQEAGFHPIDVIKHATGNNARILGQEKTLGRLRNGYLADIILVEGNPLKNLKYLYPTGVMELEQGQLVKKGGIKWTIKDGYVYHAPALLEDVKTLVSQAKNSLQKQ